MDDKLLSSLTYLFPFVYYLTEYVHENDNLYHFRRAANVFVESGGEGILCNQWLQHPREPSVFLQKLLCACLQQTRCLLRLCKSAMLHFGQ